MKTKALLRALKFVCLPTASLLLLLFFGFFSITKTIDFISSDSGWAIFLRVIVFLGEIGLVVYLYLIYLKEETKNEIIKKANGLTKENVYADKRTRDLFYNASYSDEYVKHTTESKDIIIVERIPKSEK